MEYNRGNYPRALQLAQETYRIARASGNIRGELVGIRLQALCCLFLGHFKHCLKLLDDGTKVVVRAGVQGGKMDSIPMNIKAELYQVKTEYSDARRIQETILHKTSAMLSPLDHGYALANIAFLDIATGITAEIVYRNLNAAIRAFQSGHSSRGICWCDLYHADLRLCKGDATGARVEYLRIFADTRDRDNEIAFYCLAKLADPTNPVHADTESMRWAVVFLAFALRPPVRSPLMLHQALRRLGDALVGQGANDTALNILEVALEGFTLMDVHQSRAECKRTMGDVYLQRGDSCRAREMWEAARPLFQRSEQKKEVAKIDEKLQTLSVAQKLESIPQVQAV
jgi:tetratricopeptide (TPR) repeat protein